MTRYQVRVIGATWEGFDATYSYEFDHVPTEAEVKQRAGDFQSIADYQVIEITRTGDWEREVTTRKVVRDWESEDSEDTYMCAQTA